jgi:hypothetical protein
MSTDGNSSVPGNKPLQFDVAEAGTGASAVARPNVTTCNACSRRITGEYYQVNDVIVCASCRVSLAQPRGTRLQRVLRATGLGLLAAIGGSLLYFAVAAITGREFGLVAIVVGYMVGIAVRKGSRGKGGWAYQTLAVGLTYLAIITSYVPLVAKEFQKTAAKDSVRARSATPMADTITISARGPEIGRAIDSVAAAKRTDSGFVVAQAGTPSAPRPVHGPAKHLGAGTMLVGIGALVLLAAVIPIAAGFSNIIGLLIIGIAVFEAWKLNRRIVLNITGPYRVASGPGGARTVG